MSLEFYTIRWIIKTLSLKFSCTNQVELFWWTFGGFDAIWFISQLWCILFMIIRSVYVPVDVDFYIHICLTGKNSSKIMNINLSIQQNVRLVFQKSRQCNNVIIFLSKNTWTIINILVEKSMSVCHSNQCIWKWNMFETPQKCWYLRFVDKLVWRVIQNCGVISTIVFEKKKGAHIGRVFRLCYVILSWANMNVSVSIVHLIVSPSVQ